MFRWKYSNIYLLTHRGVIASPLVQLIRGDRNIRAIFPKLETLEIYSELRFLVQTYNDDCSDTSGLV